MHAFDVLGDPVRRRLLEVLADRSRPVAAGELAETIAAEFGISAPAVSQHLRVLRESGFATVSADGTRRLYAVGSAPWGELDAWLSRYRRFWAGRLDALDTEVARGKRSRRPIATPTPSTPRTRPTPQTPPTRRHPSPPPKEPR